MDPGWLILFFFLIVEIFLVTLLVMPMPSNEVRGKITTAVAGLWDAQPVQYAVYAILAIDVFYFYFVWDALLHPLYDFGILTPVEMGVSCESKQDMFYNERNAFITGMSLFLFLILNRLVDIQDKLHRSRHEVKKSLSSGDDGNKGKKSTSASVADKKKV